MSFSILFINPRKIFNSLYIERVKKNLQDISYSLCQNKIYFMNYRVILYKKKILFNKTKVIVQNKNRPVDRAECFFGNQGNFNRNIFL